MKKLVLILMAIVLVLNSSIVSAEIINYYEQYLSDVLIDAEDKEWTEAYYRNIFDEYEKELGIEHEYTPFMLIIADKVLELMLPKVYKDPIYNDDGLSFICEHTREIVHNTGEAEKYIIRKFDYKNLSKVMNANKPFTIEGHIGYVNSYTTFGNIDLSEVFIENDDLNVNVLYLGGLLDNNLIDKNVEFNIIPINYFEVTENESETGDVLLAISGAGLQPMNEIKSVEPSEDTKLNKVISKISSTLSSFFLGTLSFLVAAIFTDAWTSFLFIIALVLIIIYLNKLIYKIYENAYFNGEEFQALKEEISSYVDDCNQLNQHIESLKYFDSLYNQKDYGVAKVYDSSNYNYKRKEFNKLSGSQQVYNCSLSICRSAQNKPFDYICKYFNIPKDEESLEYFEELFNNFSAADEGRLNLLDKEKQILSSIYDRIPKKIKKKSADKIPGKLGFHPVNLSDVHFPNYKFLYVSDGGNSSLTTDVTMDLTNLERFIEYLNEHIKWRQSVKGQRALMTPALRNKIKERDNYTCCSCHNSIEKEPNLLLEIDHIIPVSKGGLTAEDNLQTLCWKCNRSKSDKIL